ncbi:GDSL-type esterase/lipase family protein [Armatimonas sp.]|uniref:SGNH/GDSL hydrolase family protein n=1 Tax=Armatimonas sp. TaxID=1872638 RepID=UPI00286A9987|nr:GDSL-type esterase/lipase family protein [Armatimonas sp.]
MDRITDWFGFRRVSFSVSGKEGWLTEPKSVQPGKPWVWRASFPDFHAEIDRALLAAGWHIGYLETGEMLGCDAALDLWDAFYEEVTKNRGLAIKPALEAVSRGGLYAYRYAARHPERIAALYADTPVMDLKSWPGGKGKGVGAPAVWKIAFERYGFQSEAEALAYAQNPLDILSTIAKAKIPLRHVISLNDRVVPAEENTLEAQRRLKKWGATMELVTVAEGTSESQGHHFPLPAVAESAEFFKRFTRGKSYHTLRRGLKAFGPKATVAFLGGSITFSQNGWRDRVEQWLVARFPQTQFTFIRAGIPSLGSVPHAFRLETDVLAQGTPDLLFVEAAVNDPSNFTTPERMVRGLEGVVRHVRATLPHCDIIHLHFAMPEHVQSWKQGKMPLVVAQHEKVAERYQNPSLDLTREVAERIAAGEFTWEQDFKDLHPSPFGHQLYANSITHLLDAALSTPRPSKPLSLPKPVDSRSYAMGRYVLPSEATQLAGFALDPSWQPTDGKGTREGFVRVPALVSTTPGSHFTLAFTGKTVGLMIAAGPDTGTLEVIIDGKPYPAQDTFTPWSGGLHLPWAVILADDLKLGAHTLTVTLSGKRHPQATGTALRVVYFLVS